MRIVTAIMLVSAPMFAQDATSLLQKARSAFDNNAPQQRYWIWTATTTESIVDKNGNVVDALPSVTVDSPIRADGKRCSAVIAWGDGVEPYLSNATAEERCKVQEEVQSIFQINALLRRENAVVQTQTENEIKITVHPDKSVANSSDQATRCAGALEGAIELDTATYFPKRVAVTVATGGCWLKKTQLDEHYEGKTVKALTGIIQGTSLIIEFTLQKDQDGNAPRNYWIATHKHTVRPLQKDASGSMISGRLFKLKSRGPDRQSISDTITTATEARAEWKLVFEIPK